MTSYKDHLVLNNFDDDEDITDDEVFTRCGKSILEENGVNKPLMAPRQRGRGDTVQTKVRKVPPCRVLWAPILYGLIALMAIIGIICLVVFLINTFMLPLSVQNQLIMKQSRKPIVPCTNIITEDIWIHTFPMLTTETAIRLNDVNLDGIPDVIMGFGTGADSYNYPRVVCDVYFPNHKECGGGLLALNGNTGQELWRYYTRHEIFAVNCNEDVDKDGVKDCLGGGRMAVFVAVSGRTGKLIWNFNDSQVLIEVSNFYTPIYIRDLDYDGVPDIITVHGGDPIKKPGSTTRLTGRILVISGRTGKVLQWAEVPDKKESYYSPQIHIMPDGTEILFFGTGGETHGGSLWYINLEDLFKGNIHLAKAMYTDNHKGVMTPPVLADVNGDGVNDIIMAMFNSTVIAFNGVTFQKIWTFRIPSSESYSTPGVGFFNNDSIPDFIINYQIGPGFPIYYYTETMILDGRNGKPLLDKPIQMLVGTQTSPLVISLDGLGNDIFLYWISDCHGERKDKTFKYEFTKGTSVYMQSRADFCKIRFKEKLFTKMYALTSKMKLPGVTIYNSDIRKDVEYGHQLNYTAIGLSYLRKHPTKWRDYYHYLNDQSKNDLYEYLYKNDPRYNDYNSYSKQQDARYPPDNYADDSSSNDDELDDTNRKLYEPVQEYQNGYYSKKYRNYGKNMPMNDYGYEERNREPDSENMQEYLNRDWSDRSQQQWNNGREPWPDSKEAEKQYNYWRDRRPYYKTQRSKGHTVKKHLNLDKRTTSKNLNLNDHERANLLRRIRRHVGPHDGGGIQRTISTGALFPASGDSQYDGDSIDVVFATFWFYPTHTQALLPEDVKCIEARMAGEEDRFQHQSSYYGMDHDAYEIAIREECLKQNNHYVDKNKSDYSNIEDFNPYDLHMGQMTVYRTRISCQCSKVNLTSGKCAKILPYEFQGWTAYLGEKGNCLFNRHPST